MIEVHNVIKQYRLGAIGGTTLRAELQTKLAKLRGLEDPNSKLDARQVGGNRRFNALDGVSFSVQPGEAVGIIGHNQRRARFVFAAGSRPCWRLAPAFIRS